MSQQDDVTVKVTEEYILGSIHSDDLDEEHSFRIEEEIKATTKKAARRPLILDLSEVKRVRAESLGAFVDLLHQCRDDGRRMILAGLQPQVLQIMSLTKLGRLFEFRDTVDDAVTHLEPEDSA